MAKPGYRPDIDGLRAIAVLVVVFYHLGFETFSGGFVGVDVFFVISGYLITSIIKNKVRSGTFSITDFFMRRVRRLYPALFAVVAASFGVAYYLLPPPAMQNFSGSVVSSILSFSNIYFWSGTGYFDSEALAKPLLHTWSLSVEEQFYLFWPFLVILLCKFSNRSAGVILVALGALSLAAAQHIVTGNQAMAFFWMPFRIYEFCFGAVLAWYGLRAQPKNGCAEIVLAVGLVLVVGPALYFDEETVFPGVTAILPALGATLVIYAGQARYLGSLLRNKAVVFVGLISYSMYLVHWPLITFYSYYKLGGLSTAEKMVMLAVTVLLGYLSFLLVETPFRKKQVLFERHGVASRVIAYAASLVMAVVPAASAWSNQGWPKRVPEETQKLYEYLGWGRNMGAMDRGVCFISKKVSIDEFNKKECMDTVPGNINVLVYGDSHAAHLIPGLRKTYPKINFLHASSNSCKPWAGFELPQGKVCGQINNFILDEYNFSNVDIVILSGRNIAVGDQNRHRTLNTVNLLQDKGIDVLVVGPTIEFSPSVSKLIGHYKTAGLQRLEEISNEYIDKTVFSEDNKSKSFFTSNNVGYASIVSSICKDNICDVFTDTGAPIAFDYGHYTIEGSRFVVGKSDFNF